MCKISLEISVCNRCEIIRDLLFIRHFVFEQTEEKKIHEREKRQQNLIRFSPIQMAWNFLSRVCVFFVVELLFVTTIRRKFEELKMKNLD